VYVHMWHPDFLSGLEQCVKVRIVRVDATIGYLRPPSRDVSYDVLAAVRG
jgi:hypothetical protein